MCPDASDQHTKFLLPCCYPQWSHFRPLCCFVCLHRACLGEHAAHNNDIDNSWGQILYIVIHLITIEMVCCNCGLKTFIQNAGLYKQKFRQSLKKTCFPKFCEFFTDSWSLLTRMELETTCPLIPHHQPNDTGSPETDSRVEFDIL